MEAMIFVHAVTEYSFQYCGPWHTYRHMDKVTYTSRWSQLIR